MVGDGGTDVQVSEDSGPDGEWASIVDRELTSRHRGDDSESGEDGVLHCENGERSEEEDGVKRSVAMENHWW